MFEGYSVYANFPFSETWILGSKITVGNNVLHDGYFQYQGDRELMRGLEKEILQTQSFSQHSCKKIKTCFGSPREVRISIVRGFNVFYKLKINIHKWQG